MPRPSYEEHRARKRRGSFLESETDAESLASYTTFQSSTTYSYSHQQPTYEYASSSRLTVPTSKPRTLSSASFSSTPSVTHQGQTLEDAAAATRARREARRKRREEREKRSTLVGERYDSPLRRIARWCAKHERKREMMGTVFILTVFVRATLAVLQPHSDPYLTRQVLGYLATRAGFLKQLETISEDSLYWLETTARILVESCAWYLTTKSWSRGESERRGRSWRSMALAQTTMLFTPTFLIPTHSSTVSQIAIPLALAELISRCGDKGLAPTTNHFMEPYILILLHPGFALLMPVLVSFSTGSNIRGVISVTAGWQGEWVAPIIKVFKHLIRLVDPLVGPSGIAYGARRWFGHDAWATYHSLVPSFDIGRLDCSTAAPNIWCASDVAIHWANWMPSRAFAVMSAIATVCALLPSILIPLYVSYTVKTGSNSLLPTALFTSSLGLLLFLPQWHATDLIFALLPLSMMTSMRGGKDDMGDTDESWEMGVLVQNTVAFALLPFWRSNGLGIPAIALTTLWNWVIGYSPLKLAPANRTNTLAVYGVMIAVCALEPFYPAPLQYPALWTAVRQLVGFAVFETAWIWGLTRLYLQAWSLAGPGMGLKVE